MSRLLAPPRLRAVVCIFTAAALMVLGAAVQAPAAGRTLRVGGYHFFLWANQASCTVDNPLGVGTFAGFSRTQCAYVDFVVDGGGATTADGEAPELTPAPSFDVTFLDEANALLETQPAEHIGGDVWRFAIDPLGWTDPEPGTIRFSLDSTSGDTLTGQPSFQFTYNALGTRTLLDRPVYEAAAGGLAAEDLIVRGVTWERFTKAAFVASDPTDGAPNPDLVAADVTVTLTRKDGTTIDKTATADATGQFDVTFTPAEIGDVSATAATGYRWPIEISTDGVYLDPATDEWKTASIDTESTAHAIFRSPATGPEILDSFVSERGWVEPGEQYVHEIRYRNRSAVPASGVTITEVLPPDVVFVSATPAPSSVSGNTLTWTIGTVAPDGAVEDSGIGEKYSHQILVTARAKTGAENPRIMYQNLSSTATLTHAGGSLSSTSHGPQVRDQETARLGDRPFPVVLVDYADFKHSPAANGWSFHYRISSHENPASLWTHYQNMSYTQLHPRGDVASFDAPDAATYSDDGPFKWSNPYLKGNTCTGATLVPPDATASSSVEFAPPGARVNDGWYQLPGQRQYYGQDGTVSGIAPVGDIDSGCGPTGKMAYDSASASDPDVDFNDFDSDRNCLVDFFEIAFQGRGGNGDSQAHGYDNVWPHSGNLQDSYIDENGQVGYVSNDQCRDRLERPLWFTDSTRSAMTTTDTGDDLKAHSRVGPYNVNPENGTTSVFAHEYGHSLGLPDLYSGDRTTVDYWDLMSTDGFQYMGVWSRQDLGWIVPRRTPAAISTSIGDSKVDTHRIDAVGSDGAAYALTGPEVHNGDAYYVELPHRVLFEKVPSGTHAFYSTAGNAFGCPGRTMDVRLDTTRQAAEGSTLTLTLTSWFEIEWDFDYGFVMISTDGGSTFASVESQSGTSTPQAYNPNNNVCQQTFGNGITGTSTSINFPSNIAERTNGDYPEPAFIDDTFDISACAGVACVIRLAYSTDTGLAKRGWVVDDLNVAGSDGTVYFDDDVEKERIGTYSLNKWLRFKAGPSPFDHGYYVELRDRTGNDYDSAGQGERHPIDFIPGISIWYTDEAHGYGNSGTDDPPSQITLDPRWESEQQDPRLSDASFFPMAGLNTFTDTGWTDNYVFLDGSPFGLNFGCFAARVNSIAGLGSGSATAGLTMTTNPKNCIKVLGISQGAPKPVPKVLPPTGIGGGAGIAIGMAMLIVAGIASRAIRRRPLLARTPD